MRGWPSKTSPGVISPDVDAMPALANRLFRITSALLAVAILVQFFIAGMAALTNPNWWMFHQAWVGVFQWLVLPLPVLAWLRGPPRLFRVALSCVPATQMELQYVLAHRALDGRLPIGMGLHAVNAVLLLMVVTVLFSGWPNNSN